MMQPSVTQPAEDSTATGSAAPFGVTGTAASTAMATSARMTTVAPPLSDTAPCTAASVSQLQELSLSTTNSPPVTRSGSPTESVADETSLLVSLLRDDVVQERILACLAETFLAALAGTCRSARLAVMKEWRRRVKRSLIERTGGDGTPLCAAYRTYMPKYRLLVGRDATRLAVLQSVCHMPTLKEHLRAQQQHDKLTPCDSFEAMATLTMLTMVAHNGGHPDDIVAHLKENGLLKPSGDCCYGQRVVHKDGRPATSYGLSIACRLLERGWDLDDALVDLLCDTRGGSSRFNVILMFEYLLRRRANVSHHDRLEAKLLKCFEKEHRDDDMLRAGLRAAVATANTAEIDRLVAGHRMLLPWMCREITLETSNSFLCVPGLWEARLNVFELAVVCNTTHVLHHIPVVGVEEASVNANMVETFRTLVRPLSQRSLRLPQELVDTLCHVKPYTSSATQHATHMLSMRTLVCECAAAYPAALPLLLSEFGTMYANPFHGLTLVWFLHRKLLQLPLVEVTKWTKTLPLVGPQLDAMAMKQAGGKLLLAALEADRFDVAMWLVEESFPVSHKTVAYACAKMTRPRSLELLCRALSRPQGLAGRHAKGQQYTDDERALCSSGEAQLLAEATAALAPCASS